MAPWPSPIILGRSYEPPEISIKSIPRLASSFITANESAAVLAVAIKSKKKDRKSLGIAAAIYGINLRFRKVFISGLAGSAVGGLITDLNSFYAFLFSSLATIIVSFIVAWVWGYNDQMEMGKKVTKKQTPK